MKVKSKYPLVDHMNEAYALGLFGLGADGGIWGIRALNVRDLNNVDGGYFTQQAAEKSIALMREFGIDTPVEVVKRVDGQYCNVW